MDLLDQGGDGRGERDRVNAERVARGEKDVVEPVAVGGEGDVSAVLPAGLEGGVWDAEEFVVVVAKCREPGDLDGDVHGRGRPSLARMSS